MGLETQFLYIDDLNVNNPANTDGLNQADNHLRGIKNVLTNQFPNLGDAIVTATAAEINDVANKLISFNGRTDPAVLPAAGDYDINDLGDVDTTGLTNGDSLVYNSTSGNFEVAKQGIAQANCTEQEYTSVNTAGVKIELATAHYTSTGLNVDVSDNRIENNTGSTVVAIFRCNLSLIHDPDESEFLFEMQKNGSLIGSQYYYSARFRALTMNTSFERVVSLADGDYVELWVKNASGDNEDVTVENGSTLTLQIVPGA